MKYYIGVDGGGTKTTVCIAAADSSVLLTETTRGASWREYGINVVADNIKKVIGELLPATGETIAGLALGLPLYGESEDGDRDLEKELQNQFHGIPLYITNDVEAGWAGSLNLKPGINVVAGTGSIAFGKNEAGETTRAGGWSEFFSDEGSGYWIGRRVLELFSKQADGRIPKDELYVAVKKDFGLKNDYEIIDIIHNNYLVRREKIASLQLLAKAAAHSGSKSAIELYNEAVDELCLLVSAIRDKLRFLKQPFPVSYSGGIFKTEELVLPRFFKGIEAAGGRPVTPKFEPVYGALLLAFENFYPEGLEKLQKRLEELERI